MNDRDTLIRFLTWLSKACEFNQENAREVISYDGIILSPDDSVKLFDMVHAMLEDFGRVA